MSPTSMYLQTIQKFTDKFSALKTVSYYNTHWLDYSVGLRNGYLV